MNPGKYISNCMLFMGFANRFRNLLPQLNFQKICRTLLLSESLLGSLLAVKKQPR